MKKTLFILGIAAFIFSCSSPKKGEAKEEASTPQAETEAAVEKVGAVSDYMTLKDALVQTDASAAKSAASTLVQSATSENWDEDLIAAAEAIASSDDVEAQRTAFKTVTDGLIEALKANDSNDGVYVQYCPMAFNNTGASWLSTSDQIRNPYFGDKMLKCGRITEEL